MLKTALPLVALALAACSSTPQRESLRELEACRAEMANLRGVDTNAKRFAWLDGCMTRKGWRASPACVETMLLGTNFCDYTK